MDVASPDRLPPITRNKLRLHDPICRVWVEAMMVVLARTMPPDRALSWWRAPTTLKPKSGVRNANHNLSCCFTSLFFREHLESNAANFSVAVGNVCLLECDTIMLLCPP